ncbi:MAG: glucosaminidase domain-containing protein, partial [Clostridia bacterium]|nr:glucosaminidase domain-containing protein [Clostridia bacterium]
ELYDSSMNTILTDWNHAKQSIEIKYKGRDSAKYYLRVTGSFEDALKPFSVKLSSDDNEWMWQMAYPKKDAEISGRFDYYGDDDYYVLPKEITNEINKSVMRFTVASNDINVVIYDKERKMLGQYVYNAADPEPISMYGLEGAYAMSVYSYSGENSGNEYKFILEHTLISVLDIETYGFELKPGFTEDNDYYTAYVDSLSDKRITDVMYSPKEATVSLTVTQQCGYSYKAKLGDVLELAPGRNTVDINVSINGSPRTVTVVIADTSHDVSYGFLKKDVEDKTQNISIAKNEKVLIISRDDRNCKVQIISGKYIGKTMTVSKVDIYSGYEKTDMPSEYAEKINALKAKYPNWKFEFVSTGVKFDSYVTSQVGESSILDNTGKQATREQVEKAIDPINYLDEKNIFAFEDSTYCNNIEYKTAGIKTIWKNTNAINHDTISYYVQRAGEVSGISPYFITARAALESGYGGSALAQGTVNGYKGYYNFFGIGASDDDAANKGGQMAKNMNWNTKIKALIGGAVWIDSNYISNLQPTIYFMKFNPYLSWHQYMTDINAPKKDAEQLYKANVAAGTLSSEHTFIIPVYK